MSSFISGCFRLGMGTTKSPFLKPQCKNDLECEQRCRIINKCSFYQWTHSKNECSLFQSEVDELIVDQDSYLGVPDCITDIPMLWKNYPKPATSTPGTSTTTTSTTTTTPTTTKTTTTTASTTVTIITSTTALTTDFGLAKTGFLPRPGISNPDQ